MQKIKTLLLNAPQMPEKYQTKHVHCADTQNVPAPATTNVAADGSHGVIYATQTKNTAVGNLRHLHAVVPRD